MVGACVTKAMVTIIVAVIITVPKNLKSNRDHEASAQVTIILKTMG